MSRLIRLARHLAVAVPLVALAAGCSSPENDELTPAELPPAELPTLRVTVEGTRLLDALGREVLLRGVNTGTRSKIPPFIPFAFQESGLAEHADAPPFEQALEEYFDRAASWGHNVVRLPFTWDAVEPVQGTYDQVYIDRYLAMIDAAAARDLRVIVDFHQDVYARVFCGDGFPAWTLPQPAPDPLEDCEDWYMGYLNNPDVQEAFDRFWANQDGIRDAFADMWREVAAQTWPREGIMAFEVINEPGEGSADETTWAPTVLKDFYDEMAVVIREVAPGAPIIFDSSGVSAVTAVTSLERPQADGLIFGPHYYDLWVMLMDDWTGEADLSQPLGRLSATADEWGVPAFMGEFGVRTTCIGAKDYLRAFYAALDGELMHATVWEYSWDPVDWNNERFSLVDKDGQESFLVEEVMRAYPAAVAGTIESFEYDPGTRSGVLDFEARADGLTEIAVPARTFPEGVEAAITGGDAHWSHDPTSQRLVVRVERAGRVSVHFGPR